MKKFLLIACLLCTTTIASAADAPKATVKHGQYSASVIAKNGTCVRTKWQTNNDVCLKQSPAPAEVQTYISSQNNNFAQPTLEQRTVYFDFNKASLTPSGKLKIDNLGDLVKQHSQVKRLSVIGYTDEMGTENYNKTLSQKRASAVASYLQSKVTIPVDILEVRGLGESNIQSSCSPKMKRSDRINCAFKDRRVEIELVLEK